MQHRVHKYYQICSNADPELTLTYFTAMSNLLPCAFVREKGKTMDNSETIVVNDIKAGRCFGWLVVLRLNVPVNNFSVISGRSHRFLGN